MTSSATTTSKGLSEGNKETSAFVDPTQPTATPRLSNDHASTDSLPETKISTVSAGNGQAAGNIASVPDLSLSGLMNGQSFLTGSLSTTSSQMTTPTILPLLDDCHQCFIIFKFVSVYFPPATSSNTDCLTDGAEMPAPSLPPGLQPKPGSAYVVIPELSAGNACTQIANFTSLTFSFGPGELSTIQGPANITKEFNFADLPCPPPDIASDVRWFYNPAVNPTQTYAPVVAPFSQLYDLDPAFHSCSVALNQGFDPSIALPTAKSPTLPGADEDRLGHLGPLHRRRHPVTAHHVPHVALQTDSPFQG
ncbi:MAG: hypothetical protein Q9225_003569 [Loekoesia sp. 1 TL-2023]